MAAARGGIAPITIALKVDMDAATEKAAAAANETTQTVIAAYNKIGALKAGAIGGVVGAISGIGAALLFGVGAASRFEDSFAGIKKTVEATEAEFDGLAMSIRDMALEIPVATSELNAIGELGGQLGIGVGGLTTFIDTIAKLGVATRLSSETAALSLARLKEIFQLPEQQIANLAASLVDLGNNFAALEDEILNTALRLAAGAKVAGATAADTLAIATALQAVGVQSQAGGTAIARVFQAMTTAVQTGGVQLEQFVRTTGLTTETFRQLAQEDPAQVLNLFLQGISRIANEGGNYIAVLEDLNLKQQRTIRAVLALAEADDLMTDALIRGNVAFEMNVALTEEANKRFDTLKSRSKLMKNSFQELRIEVGTAFLPAMKGVVDTLTMLLQAMRDNEAEMGKFGNLAGVIIGTFSVLGVGLGAVAGQFFSLRAQADLANLSTKQFKGEVLQLQQAINAGNASFLQHNSIVSQTTARYITMGNAIKSSLGFLMPILTALTIGFTINAASNEKARRNVNLYMDTMAKSLPLIAKIEAQERAIAELRNSGASDRAIGFQEERLAAYEKELEALALAETQLFLNTPKFMENFTQEEAQVIADTFKVVNAGVTDITDDMKLLQEAAGVPIFEPLAEETEAFVQLANTLNLSSEELKTVLSGNLAGLFQIISGEIIAGADPKEISRDLDNFYQQLIGATEFSFVDAIFPMGSASDETMKKARERMREIEVIQAGLARVGQIDRETEFFDEKLIQMVEQYNQVAKETAGIEEITADQFERSSEIRFKVFKVLSNDIEGAKDETVLFNEKINDMLNLLVDASDQAFTIANAFERIGDIEIFDTEEIAANIERGKNLKNFLDLAVSELLEEGFGGIAAQAIEAGLETENLAMLFAILTGQIEKADLEFFNEQIIAGNEEYAAFGDTTEEINKELVKDYTQMVGLNEENLSLEERRAAVAEIRLLAEKESVVTGKGLISVVKEILNMKREEADTQEEIAEKQKAILDFNKDIVFDNITITQSQKEQVELAEAKRDVQQAIADFGAEGVITDKEALQLAQLSLNLEKMREKISGQRTARERKSIRDKQKEVKFLELAVEQGVAEQLDLDAAREELEDMQNPLSEAEKDILELQIKLAEQEKKVLEERVKQVSPEVITAIESYNKATDVSATRAKELANMQRDLDRALVDQNLTLAENDEKLKEILEEYPNLRDMAGDIAGLIGVPAGYLEQALDSYNSSYEGFVQIASKIKSEAASVNSALFGTEAGDGQNPDNPVSTGGAGIYGGGPINVPAPAALGPDGRSGGITNMFGVPPSRISSEIASQITKKNRNILQYLDMTHFMNNYTGGNVPIGRASIVGEMGPEVIMSTPGGTSVFSNKTGGGYGGVTVENMNVNITGLPADPISARKAAINIRKELTKLEKEGNAGTGLRNR